MAILKILQYPDERLHKVAHKVAEVDDGIRKLVDAKLIQDRIVGLGQKVRLKSEIPRNGSGSPAKGSVIPPKSNHCEDQH